MKAMILAAGYGERLRPITSTLPKPMVPICNKPLIAYAVEALQREGVSEIVVNLHHLPKVIEQRLPPLFPDLEFAFSFEPQILGTGGGIRNARSLLAGVDEFLLVNADTIQFPPWPALRAARRERDALAALTLRHPPPGDTFTAVWLDRGVITGFRDGRGESLMFSGSHVISSRIIEQLPSEGPSDIVMAAYIPAIRERRGTLAGVVDDGLWFDIGKPERYVGAARALLAAMLRGELEVPRGSRIERDSLVHETARVDGTSERSSIGARSVIEGTVRDSSIWDDCRIAAGVTLDGCIVGHGVELAEPGEWRDQLIVRDDPAIPRDPKYRIADGLVSLPILSRS